MEHIVRLSCSHQLSTTPKPYHHFKTYIYLKQSSFLNSLKYSSPFFINAWTMTGCGSKNVQLFQQLNLSCTYAYYGARTRLLKYA